MGRVPRRKNSMRRRQAAGRASARLCLRAFAAAALSCSAARETATEQAALPRGTLHSMRKVYANADEALAGQIKDGMILMAGGFGLCGVPETLIEAVRKSGAKDLTFVSNNAGVDGIGLGVLLETGQIKKMISSYVGENKIFARLYLAGELELEFNPAGHACRAHPRRGRGNPRLFYPHRRWHSDRGGQGSPRVQQRGLCHGDWPRRRHFFGSRLEGRHGRQSRLPEDGAQLQSE